MVTFVTLVVFLALTMSGEKLQLLSLITRDCLKRENDTVCVSYIWFGARLADLLSAAEQRPIRPRGTKFLDGNHKAPLKKSRRRHLCVPLSSDKTRVLAAVCTPFSLFHEDALKKQVEVRIFSSWRWIFSTFALEWRATHVENFFVRKLQYFLSFKYI